MRKLLTFATAIAVASSVALVSPAVQASTIPSPIAGDSDLRMLSCWHGDDLANAGLLKLNSTNLKGELTKNTQDVCPSNKYVDSAAFSPDDGKIYGLFYYDSNNGTVHHVELYIFDMVTGARTGPFELHLNSPSGAIYARNSMLAIDPLTGDAYLLARGSSNTTFYKLDLATQVLTEIQSSLGTGKSFGQMAFSPDGNLYAWEISVGTLVTINTTTGSLTTVSNTNWNGANTGFRFNLMKGMAFDSQGNLFLISENDPSPRCNTGGKYKEIRTASPSNGFSVTQVVAGVNPNGNPNRTSSGACITENDPWTTSLPLTSGPKSAITTMSFPIVITYGKQKIAYNGNGGTADRKMNRFLPPSMLLAMGKSGNDAVTLPSATRNNYAFNGWFTAASGGTKIGAAGDSYTPSGDADINMYAQWTALNSDHELGNVQFTSNSSALGKNAKAKLKAWVKAHGSNNGITYRVVGYVQKTKNTKNDQKLSLARANAIKKYLATLGVKVQITTEVGTAPSNIIKTRKARIATLIANY